MVWLQWVEGISENALAVRCLIVFDCSWKMTRSFNGYIKRYEVPFTACVGTLSIHRHGLVGDIQSRLTGERPWTRTLFSCISLASIKQSLFFYATQLYALMFITIFEIYAYCEGALDTSRYLTRKWPRNKRFVNSLRDLILSAFCYYY